MFKPKTLALCAALAAAQPGFAQVDEIPGNPSAAAPRVWWTGGSKGSFDVPKNRLDLDTNWSAPLREADDLGFGHTSGPTSLVNGGSGFTANSISFSDLTAYTLSGNRIQLKGSLYNGSSVRQTFQATLQGTALGAQTWNGGSAGIALQLASQVGNRLNLIDINATVASTFLLKREVMNLDYGQGVALNLTYSQLATPGGAAITGGWENARMQLVRSTWTSGGTLAIGGGNKSARVELQKSAQLQAQDLRIARNGRLTLSGGDLSFTSISLVDGGTLDWVRGTVHARGALALGALGPAIALDADHFLKVDGPLTVATGQTLSMTGKSLLTTPELHLAGGVLKAGVLGGQVPLLSGHGQWLGRVGGATTINASGGLLRIGDPSQTGAVNLSGTLSLASGASVQLDSLDLAALGSRTTLVGGNVLAAANGMALAAGDQLAARNGGRLQGSLVNDGLVITRRSQGSAGLLTLDGEVSGSGRFDGEFSFLAGISPGAERGVGIGSLAFSGSEVWLGEQARLTLDITDGAGGWTGDRLTGIGRLHAGGELRLRFHGGAPEAGDAWQALDFSQLDGSFSRITIEGLDGWQLDTEQLLASGRISVSAVPEPGTAALLVMGVAVLPWCRRRLAGRAETADARS
ncbi:hypothetical protein [Roseateles sp. LYH14W]|uniref:PEP-CTERM sorting domain-containing protein n=1 Tax=Pelomonas parva TaxID=3299032 RepID=A0ABW7EZX4_9BURK